MANGWQEVPLGKVLKRADRFEKKDELQTYHFAGTYSFARGIFAGVVKEGSTFGLDRIQRIKKGDFIYCKIMAWEGAFGIAPEKVDNYVMSGAFVAYEVDQAQIYPKFLDYYFKQEPVWRSIGSQSTGTNVRRQSLHPNQFEKATIPLPPLDEQHRIVECIERVATRIEKANTLKEESVELCNILYNTTRDKLFRELDCPRYKIDDAFDLINGRAFQPEDWSSTGMKIVRIQNLKHPEISYNYYDEPVDAKFIIRKGDVLFAWSGQIVSLGAHIWNDEDAILNQHIFNVKSKVPVLPRFIQDGFNALIDEMKTKVRGLEMFHIRKQELGKMLFPIPPLDEQRRIVAYLDSVQARLASLRELQSATGEELSALLPSVLDRAFRGEL